MLTPQEQLAMVDIWDIHDVLMKCGKLTKDQFASELLKRVKRYDSGSFKPRSIDDGWYD